MTRLSDCVEILDSKRIPLSKKQRKDISKIYPYYGAQGIIDYVDDYLFDGNYILVAEDGNNLKSLNESITTWVHGKFWVNNHAHILGEKIGYNLKYIYYLLTCMNLRGYVTGSAQPKLTQENLANIELNLPDIIVQDKIARLLSILDDKIAINNAINAELEALAKTIYDYWFLQFEFPNEEGLPYKSSGGRMVWSEELKREIPVIFTKINVMDLIEVKDGTHDSPKYVSEGKYLVTSKHLLDRGINFEQANHISDRDFELINQRSKVDTGDILFSMIGAVGTVYRVDEEIINFAIKNVALYKTSANTEYEYYLYWTLKSELMNQYIKNVMAGSIQKFIPLGSLRTMPITYNKNIIKIFSEVVGPIMKTMSQIKKETKELAALRDWLLPMLMNGQVGFKEEAA